jgi:hypothetical protein
MPTTDPAFAAWLDAVNWDLDFLDWPPPDCGALLEMFKGGSAPAECAAMITDGHLPESALGWRH